MPKCEICNTEFNGSKCTNCGHKIEDKARKKKISKILALLPIVFDIILYLFFNGRFSFSALNPIIVLIVSNLLVLMLLSSFILPIVAIVLNRNALSIISLVIEIVIIITTIWTCFLLYISFLHSVNGILSIGSL